MYATNGASVGWANGARSTLPDWQAATGEDANSISVDPRFADETGGDYHLQSVEGRYVGGGTWIRDTRHSSCIDTGDTAAAWADEPQPNGGQVNLGAYGNTGQASMSPTNTTWTLRIASEHGTTAPPTDVYTYYDGSWVECSVSPEEVVGSTQYV